jgi:pimeloyl-ACP methyl ester carboxylesterase
LEDLAVTRDIFGLATVGLVWIALFACKPAPEQRNRDMNDDAGARPASSDGGASTGASPIAEDAIEYRALDGHPGCSTAGLSYPAASIPGYRCAAKEYAPASEDTSRPIVLLVHGNSDTPKVWERHVSTGCDPVGAASGADMLSERLVDAGYRVYAADLRFDLGDDPDGNNETENAAKNMDHGWGVPIVQHFVRAVLEANPGRHVSLVGHSFGVTVIRDALRRLFVEEGFPVFERVDDLVLLAGSNHGVSTFALCGANPTMRGRVACEMGNRAAYSPTEFMGPLNGPDGAFESPCADGSTAFGATNACGGHRVEYTTIVMRDKENGEQQDIFVSEASSRLLGAHNRLIGLNDFDQTDYFFCGLFKDHYGPARALPALEVVMQKIGS